MRISQGEPIFDLPAIPSTPKIKKSKKIKQKPHKKPNDKGDSKKKNLIDILAK